MLRVHEKNCISSATGGSQKTLRASPIKGLHLQQLRLRSSILYLASQAALGAVRLEDDGSPCNTPNSFRAFNRYDRPGEPNGGKCNTM